MNDGERIKQLLKQAVRPVEPDAEPEHDLWPALLKRLDEQAGPEAVGRSRWVWLDGALLVALLVLGISFPSTIPLLLYYL